jgi:hypothetical protein
LLRCDIITTTLLQELFIPAKHFISASNVLAAASFARTVFVRRSGDHIAIGRPFAMPYGAFRPEELRLTTE